MAGGILARILLEGSGIQAAAADARGALIAPHLILGYVLYAALSLSIEEETRSKVGSSSS